MSTLHVCSVTIIIFKLQVFFVAMLVVGIDSEETCAFLDYAAMC